MKKTLPVTIILAAISCFIACAGDFIVTFTLGAFYPGYNFIDQSQSSLGTADSPVAFYINTWGVVFCLLLVTFAWGLRKSIFSEGKWQTVVVWSIMLYGVGEGAGSGLFPYDHIKNALTFSGELHSFFAAVGGVAIALIPFACSKIFPKDEYPIMNVYCWFTFFSGLICITLFLLSKGGFIPYKGLLQRVFIFDYHLFLTVLALLMLAEIRVPFMTLTKTLNEIQGQPNRN